MCPWEVRCLTLQPGKIGSAANLKIDANLTPPRLAWLVHTLSGLVMAADTFAQKHF